MDLELALLEGLLERQKKHVQALRDLRDDIDAKERLAEADSVQFEVIATNFEVLAGVLEELVIAKRGGGAKRHG